MYHPLLYYRSGNKQSSTTQRRRTSTDQAEYQPQQRNNASPVTTTKTMAEPTTISLPVVQAIQATSILSVILWMKVVVVNVGLGGAKMKAGTRAPEDTYQLKKEDVTPESMQLQDRVQRMVNNDLENIPYTMVLSWCALFCIYLGSGSTTEIKSNKVSSDVK